MWFGEVEPVTRPVGGFGVPWTPGAPWPRYRRLPRTALAGSVGYTGNRFLEKTQAACKHLYCLFTFLSNVSLHDHLERQTRKHWITVQSLDPDTLSSNCPHHAGCVRVDARRGRCAADERGSRCIHGVYGRCAPPGRTKHRACDARGRRPACDAPSSTGGYFGS